MNKPCISAAVLLLFPVMIMAQINPKSLDFGIDGFYFTSPLVVSLGGNSISGKYEELQLNSQLGVFVAHNLAFGFGYRNDFAYLSVEHQFFNSQTGAYQAYEQTNKASTFGIYTRYYFDFSQYISVFAHGEIGMGAALLRVSEQNAAGGVDLVDYDRDLKSQALGVGFAIRPQPNIGIELSAFRRTRYESYLPSVGATSILQTETYSGFEFRIGLRLNFDVLGFVKDQKREPFVPRFQPN